MLVEAQLTINGSKEAVWAAITDIENASEIISGIEKIEIVEKPANGLVGLRWRRPECSSASRRPWKSGSRRLLRMSSTKPEQKMVDLYS